MHKVPSPYLLLTDLPVTNDGYYCLLKTQSLIVGRRIERDIIIVTFDVLLLISCNCFSFFLVEIYRRVGTYLMFEFVEMEKKNNNNQENKPERQLLKI